ncbi:MAG: hypothetical protein KY466_11560 [Gemmatimonadetes bacterium]|nr:hypothetical protein [Gemmatimonadota bacterium]
MRQLPTLLLFALVVCGGACDTDGGADESRREGGTLVIAAGSDLRSFNSLVESESNTLELLQYALFLPVVRYDGELEYAPALAREWEWQGDTAVVFSLRRDVRWHDGAPTTAADVKFTLDRARDPETGFANTEYFEQWESVEVLDSFTIRFGFRPHADPLAGLPFTAVMPRHLLDSIPPDQLQNASFNQAPVGNGPFRFVSRRTNDRVVLEANPDFPEELGGRPRLDRVIWRVIPETSAQLVALRTGEVDMALGIRADQAVALDTTDRFRTIVSPSRQYQFIGWNGKVPALSDPRVRRALTMALDREAMMRSLRGGFGQITSTPVSPSHWAHDPAIDPLPYDTAAARRLLAEAGYRNTDGDPWLEDDDGQELTIELKIPANSEYNRDLAELVRGDLQDVGVRLTTRATEFGTLIGDISSPDRRFEAVLLALEADIRLNLRDLFHSDAIPDSPFQLASYADPRLDGILDSLATTVSRDRARPLWHRLQAILHEEQPWTFLWFAPRVVVVREDVNDVDMDIRGSFVSMPDWWLDPSHPRATGSGADTTATAASE